MNFLQETLAIMIEHDKAPSDVRWVGDEDGIYTVTWEQFASMADFDYINPSGGSLIAVDLVVVGDDW